MALTIEALVARAQLEVEDLKDQLHSIVDGKDGLTDSEAKRAKELMRKLKAAKRELEELEEVREDEARLDRNAQIITPVDSPAQKRTAEVHVTREPHTYSRDNDPKGRGEQFFSDVLSSYRGNAAANERLARHMREYEVDNPRYSERAAGDSVTSNFPNLVVPQYLVSEYAAKPGNARPFADAMEKKPLPAEGMDIELAVGNTVSTAARQTTELVAPAGSTHNDNPLTLSVQTAESWQQVSRQAIDRGRVTEQIVIDDLLSGMHSLIEDTVLNQATHGLFAVANRNTYDSATPSVAELYPKILAAASLSQAALKNRGKPNFALMHPRRWYWMQAEVGNTWPMVGQSNIDPRQAGQASNAPYGQSPNGLLPAGLNVIESFAVPTTLLAGAATGGTEDTLYIGDARRALLFEQPEVFIRAEQPLAKELGLLIVCYTYFAYTFEQYADAFQAINGTGTIAPAGF